MIWAEIDQKQFFNLLALICLYFYIDSDLTVKKTVCALTSNFELTMILKSRLSRTYKQFNLSQVSTRIVCHFVISWS